jgi:hypothetical protein
MTVEKAVKIISITSAVAAVASSTIFIISDFENRSKNNFYTPKSIWSKLREEWEASQNA